MYKIEKENPLTLNIPVDPDHYLEVMFRDYGTIKLNYWCLNSHSIDIHYPELKQVFVFKQKTGDKFKLKNIKKLAKYSLKFINSKSILQRDKFQKKIEKLILED